MWSDNDSFMSLLNKAKAANSANSVNIKTTWKLNTCRFHKDDDFDKVSAWNENDIKE